MAGGIMPLEDSGLIGHGSLPEAQAQRSEEEAMHLRRPDMRSADGGTFRRLAFASLVDRAVLSCRVHSGSAQINYG